eukprot:scaffold48434_cov343-Isochrysis_galbana.AAC.1
MACPFLLSRGGARGAIAPAVSVPPGVRGVGEGARAADFEILTLPREVVGAHSGGAAGVGGV